MEKTCMWCGGNFYEGFECKLCGDNNPNLIEDDYPDFVDGPIDSVSLEDGDLIDFDDIWSEFAEEEEDDAVHEPSHYTRWPIEPITYIMRNGMEFWRGNIIKYASRAGFKGDEEEDLRKVIRYAEMRINQINGEIKL